MPLAIYICTFVDNLDLKSYLTTMKSVTLAEW